MEKSEKWIIERLEKYYNEIEWKKKRNGAGTRNEGQGKEKQ